jgi:preprotein translocase subunit SecG
MLIALTIAHVVISLILIIMVLLQDSKGDASGLLGGGGQSVFGATGATTFIVKATRTVAALFAVCCISLAYLTSNQSNSSGVFDRVQTPTTPAAPADTAVPGALNTDATNTGAAVDTKTVETETKVAPVKTETKSEVPKTETKK